MTGGNDPSAKSFDGHNIIIPAKGKTWLLGVTGRRSGLKSRRSNACRFDPDRSHQYACVAQMAERGFCKSQVAGSIPAAHAVHGELELAAGIEPAT